MAISSLKVELPGEPVFSNAGNYQGTLEEWASPAGLDLPA